MARVPSSVGTRKRLNEMLGGDTGEIDTSTFVRQAVRLMIEEALEAEVGERLGRGYYERGDHGAENPNGSRGYRNGVRVGRLKADEEGKKDGIASDIAAIKQMYSRAVSSAQVAWESAEIEGMRTAGRLGSEVLDMLTPHIKPGVTTLELDRLAHDYIVNVQQAVPATLGYQPPGYPAYPASLCASVNDQVCHGIPNDKPLKDGDIVNIDVTVIKDGWHGDNSRMFVVGKGSTPPGACLDILEKRR